MNKPINNISAGQLMPNLRKTVRRQGMNQK